MIVNCELCAARYKLDDNKVTGRGARITCPKCRHVFVVYPEGTGPEPAAGAAAVVTPTSVPTPAAPAAPPKPTRSAESLDFRKVGIASWKVRVRIGLVYDFSDIKTLRKYIQDGRVTSDDVISHDARTWVTLGDIPDLDAYFIKVYEQAEASAEPGPTEKIGGFEDEDTPTMIVGMGTLGNDLAADALRQVSSEPHRTPNPVTPSNEGQFVDPFAALKSKQRDRIQARRSTSNTPTPTASSGARPRNMGPLVLVLVLLLAAGGYWYTRPKPAPAEPAPTDQTPAQTEEPATDKASGQSELRDQVNKTLQDGGAEPIAPEPQELVPVRPGEPVRPNNIKNPGGQSTGTDGVTTNTNIDHAANCTNLTSQGDWSQAVMACKMAASTNPSGAVLTSYGIALYNTGDRRGAETQLRAAQKKGGSPSSLKYLGHIARDNGDSPGASGYYQQYLNTNPSDRAAIEEEIRKLGGT